MHEFRISFQNRLSRVRFAEASGPLAEICETGADAETGPPSDGQHTPGEGRADGQSRTAAANDANRELVEAAWAAIDEQLAELERRRQESFADMQQAVVELALAVASRLVHQSLQAGDFAIEEVVKDIIARCDASLPVTIRLHPADLELLRRRTGEKEPTAAADPAPTIIADASLARGDCRADAGDFGILANLEMQLSELRQHLGEHLEDAQIERRQPQTTDRKLRRFPDRRESA